MSTCEVRNCMTDFDLWKVFSDSQDFCICDHHLNLHPNYEKLHQASVLARLHFQSGNTVYENGWTLKKETSTWKKIDTANVSCSVCSSTQKIWVSYQKVQNESKSSDEDSDELEFNTRCDQHLERMAYRANPKIRAWNNNLGISTIESTWTETNEDAVPPPRKRNKGNE